jgi:hypothetical protein
MLRIPLALGWAARLALAFAAPAGAGAGKALTQPPPVRAAAFPMEPAGTPPADGDGLIPNPATSTVAGHDPFALYIDAFGRDATIRDVYVHDNTVLNQSQFFLTPSAGMPVVDLGGIWSNVQIWHNTITGLGPPDRFNPLFEADKQPTGGTNVVDCNAYANLPTAGNTVNGNFALPSNSWLTLANWQKHNLHGWDADSAVGGFSANCPERSIQ